MCSQVYGLVLPLTIPKRYMYFEKTECRQSQFVPGWFDFITLQMLVLDWQVVLSILSIVERFTLYMRYCF